MRTAIYIDGFNLYYGCLKGSNFKWLDLKTLFTILLQPHNQIVAINYFTARVKAKPNDASAPQRQQAYIRALENYIPEINVRYGHFLQNTTRMANANPPPNTVEVIKTEEKGSDVNLAVHLLNDAWLDSFDCAVVVSNDSDMAESMSLIRRFHPKKTLGLITPGHKKTSQQLKEHAHFVKTIRNGALRASQLPDTIPGTTIRKPADWF
jgi:uncharacterized LabA/DUF88 family protein